MLSNLILLQSISPIVYLILSVQYHATRFAIITACLVWFYCYTVPVECFLMAEALLTEVAGYDVPQWSERLVVRTDITTDEVALFFQAVDVESVLSSLSWNELRKVAKVCGLKCSKTKVTIMAVLTQPMFRDRVLTAIV